MKPKGHWRDEALIDAILQKLPPAHRQKLNAHLRTCEWCSNRYEQWQTLLHTKPAPTYEHDTLKRRLMRSVTRIDQKKEGAARRKKKTLAGFGLAAMAVLVFLFLQLQPTYEKDYTAIQDDTATQVDFIHDPRTIQYDITPVTVTDIRGGVWVNDTTNEMLIHIEGLVPMAHKDYQIWFIDSNRQLYGKVIELQNGKAALYLYGDGIRHVQHVRTNLEPKGGSPIPTGTDIFIVELER